MLVLKVFLVELGLIRCAVARRHSVTSYFSTCGLDVDGNNVCKTDQVLKSSMAGRQS